MSSIVLALLRVCGALEHYQTSGNRPRRGFRAQYTTAEVLTSRWANLLL